MPYMDGTEHNNNNDGWKWLIRRHFPSSHAQQVSVSFVHTPIDLRLRGSYILSSNQSVTSPPVTKFLLHSSALPYHPHS